MEHGTTPPAGTLLMKEELHKLSYSTHAVQLKSAGNAVVSHLEDTVIIREELESLTSEEKYVVLVMHSYGGNAAANAVSGLELAAREQRGEKLQHQALCIPCCFSDSQGQEPLRYISLVASVYWS